MPASLPLSRTMRARAASRGRRGSKSCRRAQQSRCCGRCSRSSAAIRSGARRGSRTTPERPSCFRRTRCPRVCHDYARAADRSIAADACGVARLFSSSSAAGVSARLLDALARARAAIGPSPSLACVSDVVGRAPAADNREAYANAAVLTAAALNGRRTAPGEAALPASSRACAGVTVAQSIDRIGAAMSDARRVAASGAKNEAMRELLRTAGPQWAGAMLLGLVFVDREPAHRDGRCSAWRLALAAWARRRLGRARAVALRGRPPVPRRARRDVARIRVPAPFVLGLSPGRGGVSSSPSRSSRRRARSPQAPASRIGYPGFVLATGVGFLVLLDLSANASIGNRYLALYHQGHLWLAMLGVLRGRVPAPAARARARLDALDRRRRRERHRATPRRRSVAPVLLIALVAVLSGAFGALLANLRQVTSELGRLWLMVGAAWFFFMRGTPLAERLARSGSSLASLARYVMPLAFVALVLVGAMVVTRDMGPLLIAGYGAGAFLAASIAMWLHQRFGARRLARVAGGPAVRRMDRRHHHRALPARCDRRRDGGPTREPRGAARLRQRPARARHLVPAGVAARRLRARRRAVVRLRRSTGRAPACPRRSRATTRSPRSSALFGWTAAWALTIGCAVWLHRLIRHHGRVTRGEPRLVALADAHGQRRAGTR